MTRIAQLLKRTPGTNDRLPDRHPQRRLDREMIQQMVNENKEALLIAQTNLADSEKKLKEIEEQNQKAERNCSDLQRAVYMGGCVRHRQPR